ncbi:DUF3017 domain-containing protein [Streptomyces hebeiensis]|uniref:DUF3017 domain-containing protein n=1 Tax=Streptomyces hebeiensis TaxID=229486 RepID=UPI0031D29868
MGAGTSAGDVTGSEAAAGSAATGEAVTSDDTEDTARGGGAEGRTGVAGDAPGDGSADGGSAEGGSADGGGATSAGTPEAGAQAGTDADEAGAGADAGADTGPGTGTGAGDGAARPGAPGRTERARRFSFTRDTARPEGGGRAASGAAPAPARQWPLISVLGTTGLGLLTVTLPFAEAFRVGTILVGVALIGGAVLRRVLPSVGMLAVRSRFTDMLTYGLLGVAIVLLSLMTQPKPWLEIPFLNDIVHSTVP